VRKGIFFKLDLRRFMIIRVREDLEKVMQVALDVISYCEEISSKKKILCLGLFVQTEVSKVLCTCNEALGRTSSY